MHDAHTPGPWLYDPQPERLFVVTVARDSGHGWGDKYIAQIEDGLEDEEGRDEGRYPDEAEAEANGRLIAAAPSMLEALKCIADNGRSAKDADGKTHWAISAQERRNALDAISEATGKSPGAAK